MKRGVEMLETVVSDILSNPSAGINSIYTHVIFSWGSKTTDGKDVLCVVAVGRSRSEAVSEGIKFMELNPDDAVFIGRVGTLIPMSVIPDGKTEKEFIEMCVRAGVEELLKDESNEDAFYRFEEERRNLEAVEVESKLEIKEIEEDDLEPIVVNKDDPNEGKYLPDLNYQFVILSYIGSKKTGYCFCVHDAVNNLESGKAIARLPSDSYVLTLRVALAAKDLAIPPPVIPSITEYSEKDVADIMKSAEIKDNDKVFVNSVEVKREETETKVEKKQVKKRSVKGMSKSEFLAYQTGRCTNTKNTVEFFKDMKKQGLVLKHSVDVVTV